MKVLVVEDEEELLHSISHYFLSEGYVCEAALTYDVASEKIHLFDYDCYIFDIGLPDGNGIDLLKELKKIKPDAGVIILSAKNSLDDKLLGLNGGADDYLTKPFHLFELNARVKAIIRRLKGQFTNEITFNEITLVPETFHVAVHNKEITLTKKEFDLLLFFVLNKNKVISKESIAEHLWGDDVGNLDSFNFIYTHLRNLRKKIEEAGGKDYFQTIYNVGYKLVG